MSTIESSLRGRGTRIGRGLAGRAALVAWVSAAAAVGVCASAAAPAHADAFVRLPGGTAHGAGLTLTRSHESAQISPSLAANGLGRTAWVSADITLAAPNLKASPAGANNGPLGESTAPGTGGTSTDGAAATLSAGYIVGCQVNVNGVTTGVTGSINSTGVPSGTGTLSVPITPGQVVFVQIDYKDVEKAGTYYFNYDRVQLQIQNCAGYAQARSYVTVETTGTDHQKVNLYGKPFSIG